ncbi:hypothetical protein E4198_19980 [Streptomyces sp. RKND-216]|uniref:hypothetical protein n=1 Tax=Streptomyces sp. RKND-216 TaxID=2562581 RepID=UPI00109D8D6D|nr:hypothetical protein [Streptomyces sp. RKND-216]THA26644.1 hypothetical protein E4198_19980 [Streptomyces sp. RKND-216]
MSTVTRRSGASTAGVALQIIADILAGIIALWIALYLLEANPSNELVDVLHDAARWLAGWSYDLFPIETDWLNVLVNYGIAAAAYLLIGHGLAVRLRRA